MTSTSISEESLEYWKEGCVCSTEDFLQCRCGLARKAGLVCEVCEAELVVRYSKKTNKPFWACSNFARTGCQYTRSVECLPAINDSKPSTIPSKQQHGTKRPAPVTPHSSRPVDSDRKVRKTTFQPRCLFPASRSLQDTFIGTDLAKDLVAHGFPATVFSVSERRTSEEGTDVQQKLYYEENRRSGELFCYWYNQEIGKRPAPLGRKPVVLELFAGAGGMSLGLKRAGFDVKFAVEKDIAAADTLRSNHKDTFVLQQDVVEFLDKTKPKGPCYPKEIEHIHASPPCQGHSKAKINRTPTARDMQNNQHTLQFPEAIEQFRPTTASFENVDGMLASAASKKYLQEVVAEMLKMDYQVRVMLLNAADYGDPQNRKRLFLFAAKKEFPLPQVPVPTHRGQHVTADQALGNLETTNPVEYGDPVLLVNDNNNDVVYDHSIYQQMLPTGMDYLQKGKPAKTVRRRNGIRHYQHDREITIRERARIQSFPDWYHFCGTPDQQSDQIGNAVPVKLAEAVAESIMESYQLNAR